MKARALGVEFALGPLLRGEWRATELTVSGPEIHLLTDANGQVSTPGIAFAFNPGDLAIEKLSIEDGKFSVADPDGGAVTLERVWFNGDARSLLGPLKGRAPSPSPASCIRSGSRPAAMARTTRSSSKSMSIRSIVPSASKPMASCR